MNFFFFLIIGYAFKIALRSDVREPITFKLRRTIVTTKLYFLIIV